MLLLLKKFGGEKYDFITATTQKENVALLDEYGIECIHIDLSFQDKLWSYIRKNALFHHVIKSKNILKYGKFDRFLLKMKADMVYFLSPSMVALSLEAHNYIIRVFDFCHRENVEFPEVYSFREFEEREYVYQRLLPKAVAVIVDSQKAKEKAIKYYGLDEQRVTIQPYLPSSAVMMSAEEDNSGIVDMKKKYGIPGDYIFYPAQLWPHKNHHYILEALKVLKEKYQRKINAAFSGSDQGNLSFIKAKVKEYGIQDQIFFLNFVDDKEIPHLYKQAIALVMPTYFGPTNVPPLEAFYLGCPVCYSDFLAVDDQISDAVFTIDLGDPESLVKALITITEDRAQVETKTKKGKQLVRKRNEEAYWQGLKFVFEEYEKKMNCWK